MLDLEFLALSHSQTAEFALAAGKSDSKLISNLCSPRTVSRPFCGPWDASILATAFPLQTHFTTIRFLAMGGEAITQTFFLMA
jgi:hypothetical protein